MRSNPSLDNRTSRIECPKLRAVRSTNALPSVSALHDRGVDAVVRDAMLGPRQAQLVVRSGVDLEETVGTGSGVSSNGPVAFQRSIKMRVCRFGDSNWSSDRGGWLDEDIGVAESDSSITDLR